MLAAMTKLPVLGVVFLASVSALLRTPKAEVAPSPATACPRVGEPPAPPHPALPPGEYRYPYNNPSIEDDVGDGCPGIAVHAFENNALPCPSEWRINCTNTGGDEHPSFCRCGHPSHTGSAPSQCHKCTGQPNHLTRKPANVTAFKANDLCGRYPPITRRQIIERALGWVTNGWLYGLYRKPGWTPESCGSEDEAACPQYSYESVCNGLLEMAWKSDDTNVGPGKKKSWPPTKIDCLDVRPGDWLHIGHHMQMFRRWVNGSGMGKTFVLYQMGGGWGKANAVVSTFTDKYAPCYRRPNIINDDHETKTGKFCSTHRVQGEQ